MKTKICSIFGLAAFVIAPLFAWADDLPRPDPTVAEFARGVKFTVAGYNGGSEVQTNFPVLVRLSTAISGFKYSDFYADGSDLSLVDIGFVDAETNGIPYEIDTWNPSGESLVWVNLPRMTNGTEFAMWYRSSKTGKVLNSDNVWADYTGVWHLNESGSAGTAVKDSSTNALDCAAQGKSTAVAAGKIGGSWQISDVYDRKAAGLVVDASVAANNAKLNALGSTFHVSFWFKTTSTGNSAKWCVLLGRRGSGSDAGWALQLHDTWNQLRVYGNGGEKNAYSQIGSMSGLAAANVWAKVDVVWYADANGKGRATTFYNGGQIGDKALWKDENAVSQVDNLNFVIGNFANLTSDRALYGVMDEVRLGSGKVSAARVRADYDTVNTAAFLTAGSVVEVAVVERPVANLQIVDTGASHVQFGNAISSLGSSAANECAFNVKVWKTAEGEPADYTALATGLPVGALSGLVKGLTPATAYSYKIKVTNDEGVDSDEVTGAFTTSGVGVGGTGGDMTRVGDDWIHYFRVGFDEQGAITNDYVFTPPSYANSVRALVVGGGGPGGYYAGGGGGAGGYYYNAALGVTPGTGYSVHVGAGGVAATSATAYGSNGGNSSIKGGSIDIEMIGGGAGGNGKLNDQTATFAGQSGGSGGGTAWSGYATGSGTADQGHDGGDVPSGTWQQNLGAGGGGAAAVGGSIEFSDKEATKGSGVGGNGRSCDITGESLHYAGGGSGGAKAVITSTGTGTAGAAGNGGGGKGGQYDKTEGSQYASAGVDGFGGGGGGGSTYSEDSYQGGDGGDGIVIIRYASQGEPSTVPEPIISLQSATCNDAAFTGDIAFRVAWAGYGHDEVAQVKAVWGYAKTALTHTDVIATDAIGLGTGSFPLKADKRTVYVKLLAVNADGEEAYSSEMLSFYVNENENAEEEVLPNASDVLVSRVDGAYATVTGLVTSAGASRSVPSNCVVRVSWGTSAASLNHSAQATFEVGAFALNMDGLSPNTTYYWEVELQDDDGNVVVAATGASFTTIGQSVSGDVTAVADQRTFTVTAPLNTLGAGTTYVLVRWSEDNGKTWGDFVTAGTRTALDAPDDVTLQYSHPSWVNLKYECVVSNECVTSAGVPNGTAWSVKQTGTINLVDKAIYTWQAVDGDWNGNWTNVAHWASDKPDNLGYPRTTTATASFRNCTLANPVVVTIDGKYSVGAFVPNAVDGASDITFRGAGRASSGITAQTPVQYNDNANHVCSDTQIKFEEMAVTFNNDWQIMRHAQDDGGPVAYSNILVRFSNVALNVNNNKQLKICAPYSRMEFTDGTTATAGEVTVSGTDSVLLVDNSTVTANTYLRLGVQCLPNDGEAIVFRGEAPKLTAKTWFSPYKLTGQPAGVVFEVPVGGYAEVPFVFNHGTNTFGEPDKADGTQATHTFAVSPNSPALKVSGTIENNVLIQTTAGFYETVLSDNSTFTVPERDGSPTGAFKWGVGGAPLAEEAELSTARQLLLNLTGHAQGVLFLIY